MPRFLTPEWVEAVTAAAAAAADDGGLELAPDVELAVGHVVRGGPLGEVRYLMRVAGGQVRAELGDAYPADVTLYEDYDTAVALARGELTAQEAVSRGRLKLAGDVSRLLHRGPALAAVATVLDQLRTSTTY